MNQALGVGYHLITLVRAVYMHEHTEGFPQGVSSMPAATIMTSGSISSTRSKSPLNWVFVGNLDAEATPSKQRTLGTVRLDMSRRKVGTYVVVEHLDTPRWEPHTRVIRLVKQEEPREVYDVAVLLGGSLRCSGEWCGRHDTCKHRQIIQGLIDAGGIEINQAAVSDFETAF